MENDENKFNMLIMNDECVLRLKLSDEIIKISEKHIKNYSFADDTLNKDLENIVLRYIGRLLTIEPATEKQIYRIKQICKKLSIEVPATALEDKKKAYEFLRAHMPKEE